MLHSLTKRCAKCHEDKRLKAFGTYKRSPDGKRWECKDCRKKSHEANKEVVNAKAAVKRANRTPEQRLIKAKKDAAYYQATKDKHVAYNRKQREENPEKYSQYFSEYQQRNKPRLKKQAAIWRVANRAKRKASEARRRARKANAPIVDLTDSQWQEVLIAFDFRCAYCPPSCKDCRYKRHKLTQEHVTPYEHNGSHTLWNVVPACQPCNSRKKDRAHPPKAIQPLLLTIAPSKPVKRRKAS